MSQPGHTVVETEITKPIEFLKGVGLRRAELLERLGLRIARDILYHFPRDYQDMSELRTVEQLEDNCPVSICGHVEDIELKYTGIGRTLLGILIRQGNQYLRALWFNQPYMRERFTCGQKVFLSGKARLNGGRWEMSHPHVEGLSEDQAIPTGQILPIYALTEGVNQGQFRRITEYVLTTCLQGVEEVFPDNFLNQHQLMPIHTALREIHFPSSRCKLESARQRFVYQELFILQLAVTLRRNTLQSGLQAPQIPVNAKVNARIRRLLPFQLTASQSAAVDEIARDMVTGVPMNRLLQGDVGSGKTVVAVCSMLSTVAHGHQAVLMAPTEILARQHAETLKSLLQSSRVRCGLLTGALTQQERTSLVDQIATGQIDVIVGTQALLQADVKFAKLGLVVIDEQHKFGVGQRAGLRRAGFSPHYLVMTATPIPRTISMTLFGDLDITTLRDSPPGRQKIHTYFGSVERRQQWWEFFRRKLREGRQGFIIAPRVDDSTVARGGSVNQAFEELANGELEAFRLNLIHGKMNNDEKIAAMQAFRRGETQVLVATSVVEVGVDVPNATLMTIENGEWFGLAQLHQLRGRISRGTYPGYLCVFSNATSDEACQRLEAFVSTNDGFELAEIDFRQRGPGDLFSMKQHGLPPLRIADLRRDEKLLQHARQDAQSLMSTDTGLSDPQYARLRRMMRVRYGQALELSDVG